MVTYFLSENSEYFQDKINSSIVHEQRCLALHKVSKHFFFVCKKLTYVSKVISRQTYLPLEVNGISSTPGSVLNHKLFTGTLRWKKIDESSPNLFLFNFTYPLPLL